MLHLRHLAGGAAVGASAALFSSDQAARARHPLLLEERRHSKPRSGPAHVAMGRQLASSRFKEGDWFEWEYRDSEGQPSSWERYSVLSTRGDEVLIDMASKMRETDDYQVWHRMHLSLSDSLAASSHPSQWSFRKFGYWQEGKWWEAPHRDNVQAFEEKFNSFLMVGGADAAEEVATRRCEIAALGETKLVQSDRHRHTAAWYVQEPQRWAGLAALKAFGEEGAPGTYVFELIACGSDGAPMPT